MKQQITDLIKRLSFISSMVIYCLVISLAPAGAEAVPHNNGVTATEIICQYIQSQEKVLIKDYSSHILGSQLQGGELKVYNMAKVKIVNRKFKDTEDVIWNVKKIPEGHYTIIWISGYGKTQRKFTTKFILERGKK